jgi:hypothetical protein
MGQVNVNTPGTSGDGGSGAAAGMSMMLIVLVVVVVLALLFWFLLRPMLFGGPANVNVNVRSSDVLQGLGLVI